MSDSIARKLLETYFSDLVFSYLTYARGIGPEKEADAVTLLILLFSNLVYTFSRGEILGEFLRRRNEIVREIEPRNFQ